MSSVAILTGPTATGKSGLALELAAAQGVELINADSMLVYRGMDIGTAKPTAEELKQVPHHLIDVRDPGEPFTAGDFVREVHAAMADVEKRGKRAMIVGGTGFYLKALIYGLWEAPKADPALRQAIEKLPGQELFRELEAQDPDSAYRIGPADHYRLVRAVEILRMTGKSPSELEAATASHPDPRFALWIVDRETEELSQRIQKRTQAMIDAGFVDEVKALRAKSPGSRALLAVGYAQVCDFLDGKLPEGRKIKPGLEGLVDEIALATRQLVKRQRTWFRGQHDGTWFTLEQDRDALEKAFHALY